MDVLLPIVMLVVAVIIAFSVGRFLLRLTARVIGCILTAIVVVGIAFILLNYVL